MRRDLVTWTFALGVTLIVLLSFTPAFAYTVKELLGDRNVPINCNKETRVCTIAQDDLEWMASRDQLMHELLERTANQLKQCGVKGV